MGYPARIEIMGAPIDPYTMEQTVSRTKDFVETGVFAHLAGVNADKLLQMRSDQTMDRMIRQCEIVNADGASMVMAARRLGIDILVERLRAQHIKRLKDGVCSIDTGVVYLDVLSNAERISDHCSNIAARLVGMEAGEDYDSHTLKNMMHHNPTKEYMLNYEQCRRDYLIPLEQLEA